MKIRTARQLRVALSAELIWRKKELATIRSLIRSKKWTTDQRNAIIRSAITVLYAHWEGFVKAAASAYLEFVSSNVFCGSERNGTQMTQIGMIYMIQAFKIMTKHPSKNGFLRSEWGSR